MARIDSGKTFDKEGQHDKMKVRMENMDVKPYLLNIPAPLYKKVKRKLLEEERSMKSVIVEYLYKYINE
jgi:hypothetical protein